MLKQRASRLLIFCIIKEVLISDRPTVPYTIEKTVSVKSELGGEMTLEIIVNDKVAFALCFPANIGLICKAFNSALNQ